VTAPPNTIAIYVDADACPVKQEVYRVAQRQWPQGHCRVQQPDRGGRAIR